VDFNHDRVEARSVAFTDIDASSDGGKFTGYAAVFDAPADLGAHTESVNRGAFRKSLSNGSNVPMLYDHNPALPVLATTGAGTLKLKEDGRGLRVEADIARHFIGDAVREMVKRGEIRGMSFGFIAGSGNSKIEQRGGKPHRTLTGFKHLLDVSPTWNPAYVDTNAELRSLHALKARSTRRSPTRCCRRSRRCRSATLDVLVRWSSVGGHGPVQAAPVDSTGRSRR
jgi:HK97 family phage prohead protease